MPTVSFSNIDGTSHQKPNPGGIRQVYVAIARDIQGVWPKEADITAGEITTLPVMVTGKKFAEYECPDGTVDASSQQSGDPGYMSYKHMINFSLAGYSKELIAELTKHRNAGAVFIVEQNDGTFSVVGSSDNPIYLKSDFKTGKKGSDKRGFDLKGEQDGQMWDLVPLKDTLISQIQLLPQA